MSFQNKVPWVLKDVGPLTDEEMGTRTSLRIEQKRAHPFFMDASEGELFSHKKQAVQPVSDTPISTPASVNSFWGNTSNFQSAPLPSIDRSHAPEPLGNENVNSERSRFMPISSNKKAQENFNSMFPSYRKANEIFMPVGMTGNEDIGVASKCPTPDKVVKAVRSAGTCSKENASFISMNRFESAHGTVGNNTSSSGKVISSYDLVISEPSLEALESLPDRSTVEHSADQIETVALESTFRTENVSKKKVKKIPKSSPNNFPHNVRSLMATGILDGVPVKYVSWSREKTVRGFIKGTGYLCGCNDCKLSKNLSAFEFESHAACKTGHPNNNIYFETGKTIYAVVQELKNTPQEMLFEAIQNIIGSPINQKNFQTWKASLQAAAVVNFSGSMQKSEVTKPS